jgi:hypothetical protein
MDAMEIAFPGAVPDDDRSLFINGWMPSTIAQAITWTYGIAEQP